MASITAKLETFFIIIAVALIYYIQYYNWGGAYEDTDNYMHALRTLDFITYPTLFEHKFMMTNYPFGEVSHWTRLFDIIMSLCTLPFYFFEPLKVAVYHGGLLVTPLFFLMTLLCVEKWGKTELSLRSRIFLYLLFIINPDFHLTYELARPDHHAVILFLAMAQMLALHKFIDSKRLKPIIISAIICGLSLWLAVEGLFLYIAELIFLYGCYLLFAADKKVLQIFTLIYAITIGVCWLINPPYQGWLYMDNGRISLFYVSVAFYVWGALWLTGRIFRNKISQTTALALSAIILLAIVYYAGLLASPLDERIKIAFTDRVDEMKSGFTFRRMFFPLISFFCLYGLWQNKYKIEKILLLTLFLVIYTSLTAYARRFFGYTVLYTTLIIVLRLEYLHLKNFAYCGIIALLIALNPLAYYFDNLVINDKSSKMDFNVNTLNYINFPQGTIVSDLFISPYILWYAERPTIASPYHRNVEGIIDNHEILFSDNEDKVKELLKKHQVKVIILPLADETDPYYVNPSQNCDKLYGQIMACDSPPSWLQKVYRNDKYQMAIFVVHLE